MPGNVAEKLIENYTDMVILDLTLAARLYCGSECEGNPLLLMQSLFHAQQAAEKALKLLLLVTNVVEPGELKRLGHHPLLKTLDLLLKKATSDEGQGGGEGESEAEKQKKVIDSVKDFEKIPKNVKDCIEDFKKELEKVIDEISKPPCYERVQKALKLKLSESASLAKSSEKLSELLRVLAENRKVAGKMYRRLAHFNEALQFVRSVVEGTPELKDLVQRGEPLTRDQLKEIIDEVRSALSKWEFIRALKCAKTPKKCFNSSPPRSKFREKIAKASNSLLSLAALGSIPLPDGRPLLDHMVSLDVFSECGRYVEAGDGETTPELLAKKRDVARLLVFAAELWTIILIGICTMISAVRKETERKAA